MSKKRKEESEKKRQAIADSIINELVKFVKEYKHKYQNSKELLTACLTIGDNYIAEMIHEKPQEKNLILQAVNIAKNKLKETFKIDKKRI